jgi:hypothetical protein
MKKIILSLLLFPVVTLADNLNFFNVEFGALDGAAVELVYGESINGYSFGYTGVLNGNIVLDISHFEASSGDWDGGQSSATAAYAFDSIIDGSMYVGLAVTDGDLSADEELGFVIGYGKISGNGTDYNLSATSINGNVGYGVEVTAESGLSFGLSESNGASIAKIGYRISL